MSITALVAGVMFGFLLAIAIDLWDEHKRWRKFWSEYEEDL